MENTLNNLKGFVDMGVFTAHSQELSNIVRDNKNKVKLFPIDKAGKLVNLMIKK